MRRYAWVLSIFFFFLTLPLAVCGGAQAAAKVLDLAYVNNSDLTHMAYEWMSKEISQRSNGNLQIRYHPGTLLTKEAEIIDAVKSGNIAMGTPVGAASSIIPEMGVFMVPYLVRDYNQAYKPEHAVSIVASATGMGILVPPAIFMIVIGTMTNTSIVGIFLGGFIPALAMSAILMAVIYWQARRFNWPTDARPSLRVFLAALKNALIPLFVPFVMLVGFRFGIFTATEAGGIIAFYSLVVALLIYRNVTLKEILKVAEESALVSAAVVLLMGAATVYQFLMGMAQVPQSIGRLLMPLQGSTWAFLSVVALIVAFFGMVMEGLPAAVILVPVLFPAAKAMGVQPIHFNIVLTAAVGVGLFMPPIGVGLLIALRFGKLTITQHMPHYWPYAAALAVGLLVVILVPELTMWLPRGAGLAK